MGDRYRAEARILPFHSPGTARLARPAETARALHQLITELTTLATATTVTKRVTIRRTTDGTPQASPLFEEAA
jgi:hypothetical protein